MKRCSENMQQIYMRTPMSKCDFNKVTKQVYWNHTSAWVNLLRIFRAPFTKNTSERLLLNFRSMKKVKRMVFQILVFKGFPNTRSNSLQVKHYHSFRGNRLLFCKCFKGSASCEFSIFFEATSLAPLGNCFCICAMQHMKYFLID